MDWLFSVVVITKISIKPIGRFYDSAPCGVYGTRALLQNIWHNLSRDYLCNIIVYVTCSYVCEHTCMYLQQYQYANTCRFILSVYALCINFIVYHILLYWEKFTDFLLKLVTAKYRFTVPAEALLLVKRTAERNCILITTCFQTATLCHAQLELFDTKRKKIFS